jgi:hypothetical protein
MNIIRNDCTQVRLPDNPTKGVLLPQIRRIIRSYMASDEQRRAHTIQKSIHDILLRDWDPIGINDLPEAQDE